MSITTHNEAKAVLKDLMDLLEEVEVSDSGNPFRPNLLSTSRVHNKPKIEALLKRAHRVLGTKPKNLDDYRG